MLNKLKSWFGGKQSAEDLRQARANLLQASPVPVFWLIGKTGSGKSSVVRYLTGAEQAEIGSGFRPQTQHTSQYDFPSAELPILSFLDTRGLGEAGYECADDIAELSDRAHLVLVTVRLTDHAVESIIEPLRALRKERRDRPVVLVVTCLHEAYPRKDHQTPDPFSFDDKGYLIWQDLRLEVDQHLTQQLKRFDDLFDVAVPVDLTQPDDGFQDPHYGGDRLKQALADQLPAAYRQTFLNLEDVMGSLRSLHHEQATPYILSAATLAASAAAVPLPWIDMPVVAGVQTELIRRLAKLYGRDFDWDEFLPLAGAVGGRLAIRQALREPLKIIPFVGAAVNSALAFATTYGLGQACLWYYGEKLAGHSPTKAEVNAVMKEEIEIARKLWSKHDAAK